MELASVLIVLAVVAYIVGNLVLGLWQLIRSGASREEVEDALDRLYDAAAGTPRGYDPTLHPDGEYDGSKGVWCDLCWRYHAP